MLSPEPNDLPAVSVSAATTMEAVVSGSFVVEAFAVHACTVGRGGDGGGRC